MVPYHDRQISNESLKAGGLVETSYRVAYVSDLNWPSLSTRTIFVTCLFLSMLFMGKLYLNRNLTLLEVTS